MKINKYFPLNLCFCHIHHPLNELWSRYAVGCLKRLTIPSPDLLRHMMFTKMMCYSQNKKWQHSLISLNFSLISTLIIIILKSTAKMWLLQHEMMSVASVMIDDLCSKTQMFLIQWISNATAYKFFSPCKTTMSYQLTLVRKSIINKSTNNKCWRR